MIVVNLERKAPMNFDYLNLVNVKMMSKIVGVEKHRKHWVFLLTAPAPGGEFFDCRLGSMRLTNQLHVDLTRN